MAESSPANNAANNMQRGQESGAKLAESRRKHSEIQIKQNVISFFWMYFKLVLSETYAEGSAKRFIFHGFLIKHQD